MRSRSRSRRGLTLLESVIGLAVLAMLFSSALTLGVSGRRAFQQDLGSSTLEARSRHALERIAAQLTPVVRTTMTPNAQGQLGTSTLSFRVCEGAIGGVVQTSTMTQIRWQQDPADANDGADNDGDGAIDEGEIVLVRDLGGAGQTQVVLANGVAEYLEGEVPNLADDNGNGLRDERGLSFSADADGTLTIRITLTGVGQDNRQVLRTVETAVHLRN